MEKGFGMNVNTVIVASLLLFGMLPFVATDAAGAGPEDDYIYTTSGSPALATVTGYIGAGGAITIPSSLGGYVTVAIGDYAFNSANGHSLTSVTIPNSVTSIGYGAFYECTSLVFKRIC